MTPTGRYFLALGCIIMPFMAYAEGTNHDTRLILDSANGLYDGSYHVTGVVQSDKYFELTDSTSTAPILPKSGHSKTYLNKMTRQVCTEFDDGSITCIGTNDTAGSITVSTLTVTSSTTLKGTSTNDNAAAGNIGEYVSNTAAAVSAAANNIFVNIISIVISSGDWDVAGHCVLTAATITGPNNCTLSLNSGNNQNDSVPGDNTGYFDASTTFSTGMTIPEWRVATSTGTTVYLKGLVTYSGGSPTWYGRISARRVR